MLKILTVNLNYVQDGYGPWPERCRRLRALLQAQRPAIIALQAAHVDDTRNQLRELAGDLDYPHQLFLAADTTRPQHGSAILSEIPVNHSALTGHTACNEDGACIQAPPQFRIPLQACGFGFIA